MPFFSRTAKQITALGCHFIGKEAAAVSLTIDVAVERLKEAAPGLMMFRHVGRIFGEDAPIDERPEDIKIPLTLNLAGIKYNPKVNADAVAEKMKPLQEICRRERFILHIDVGDFPDNPYGSRLRAWFVPAWVPRA